MALVDAGGHVVERYVYDPYGRATVLKADWSLQEVEGQPDGTASAYGNEVLYCGYRYDPETGLYHVRHRVYHVTLGRWMQRDPQGYVDGMSLYEYVRSAPLSGYDPKGLLRDRNLAGDRVLPNGEVVPPLDDAHIGESKSAIESALSDDAVGIRTLGIMGEHEVYVFEGYTRRVRQYRDEERTVSLPYDDQILIGTDVPPMPARAPAADGSEYEVVGPIPTGQEWPAGGYHQGAEIGLKIGPGTSARRSASILVHEADHDLGGDELSAYTAQDAWLQCRGQPPVRPEFRNADGTTNVQAVREFVQTAYPPTRDLWHDVESLRGPVRNWQPQRARNLRGDITMPWMP